MRVSVFILADGAQAVDGKLYVLGGNWSRLFVDSLPAERVTYVAIGLAAGRAEAAERHSLQLCLAAPDGTETDLGRGEFEVGLASGAQGVVAHNLNAAMPVVLRVAQQGRHVVRLAIDGQQVSEVPLDVELR